MTAIKIILLVWIITIIAVIVLNYILKDNDHKDNEYHENNTNLNPIYNTNRYIINNELNEGEIKVQNKLSKLPESYKIYNNIILKYSGGSAQIDHLVISRYGLFVIETKDYQGLIIDNNNGTQWTQYLHRNRNSFYSPIQQNITHINAICEVLGIYSNQCINIVCFSDKATLSDNIPSQVTYTTQLLKQIAMYKTEKLTEQQVNEITKKLEETITNNPISQEQHIYNIQKYVNK